MSVDTAAGLVTRWSQLMRGKSGTYLSMTESSAQYIHWLVIVNRRLRSLTTHALGLVINLFAKPGRYVSGSWLSSVGADFIEEQMGQAGARGEWHCRNSYFRLPARTLVWGGGDHCSMIGPAWGGLVVVLW